MIQAFKMAMKSISGNKFRAFLTMLGIIIGVMALVILVSLVSGATGTVTDTISSLGSNLLSVTVSDDKGAPVTLDTLDEWMADPQIGLAAPSATTTATGKYSSTTKTVTVYGATPAYAPINGQTVLLGRFLTQADVENHTSVCIITEKTAEDMVGYTDCLGEEISLDGRKFTVVGILKNDDESLTGILTKNSMIAYIPYTTLMRLSATVSSTITSFSVSAPEGGNMATTESAMKRLLLDRFEDDEDAFSLLSQNMLEDAMSSVTGILTVLLGGIAAISLIVGGIGIMNIMLVTVTEPGNRHPKSHRRGPGRDSAAVPAGKRGAVHDRLRHWRVPVLGGAAAHLRDGCQHGRFLWSGMGRGGHCRGLLLCHRRDFRTVPRQQGRQAAAH